MSSALNDKGLDRVPINKEMSPCDRVEVVQQLFSSPELEIEWMSLIFLDFLADSR